MHNLRLAFRTLRRTPFITAVAVLTLALGIGVNAAIYSIFDQILLHALPVAEPERLVNLVSPGPRQGWISCSDAGNCDAIFSYPMFRDLERAEGGLAGIAAHRNFDLNVAFRRQTLNGEGMLVSGAYFQLLGLRPALGRLLGPDDDETVGGHFVAVLSYDYWRTRLGGDPSVVGESIMVNGRPMTIVGVAPSGFQGTTLGVRPHVYVPITMAGVVSPALAGAQDRQSHWVYLFGRLKPGISAEQARVALNAVFRPIINEVEAPLQQGMSDQTKTRFRAREITFEPGGRGQSQLHAEARTPLALLLAITGVVLLIACANIANLLLARGASRGMEMAVRLSLGARRRQVVGQLLTESCVLALLGGAAGLLVAQWTLTFVASILPADTTAILSLELRPSVIGFAALLSLGTGLLFGLYPALHSTRTEFVTAIRAGAGQHTGARSATRFRTALATTQIALAMALLIAAGLFLRSLVNISRIDLGVRAENVVAFGISPELNGYESARRRALFRGIEEEVATIPGVTGVAGALIPILASNAGGSNVSVEGFEHDPDRDADASYNLIGPGYFRTLEIPLLAGREFTAADDAGAPRVAIVNEAFAKKFGLGNDPVGKWMARGLTTRLDIQIVGLVRDAKYNEVKGEVPPLFFTPYRQDEKTGSLTFYVRTAGDPTEALRAIPGIVARLDPDLPVENLTTLPQQASENVYLDRMISTLAAAFAVLATLLAAIGLYGVLAYTVEQRTREIGVRMALGADGWQVRAMVLRQVGRMILIGGAIGIVAALGLGRAAQSVLFGLDGYDPVVIVLAAVVLGGVALGAGYLPARRASRVEPVRALRYE
jgi:predicted permease